MRALWQIAFVGLLIFGGTSQAADQTSAAAIKAREADITGKPPRIAPLAEEDLPPAMKAATEARKKAHGFAAGPTADYILIMMRHPNLTNAVLDVSLQISKGTLAPRDRELAILTTGWLCKTPFVWGEHVERGKAAGLTAAEIERVTHGSAAPDWNDHDRAVIRAVEELRKDAMISDQTWAVLKQSLNEKQLIELPVVVGQYEILSYTQNALRSPLMSGNPGLTAR
jgi:alkylhydroperoxidase family enzyme